MELFNKLNALIKNVNVIGLGIRWNDIFIETFDFGIVQLRWP